MREVVLDTETTGLDPLKGDKLVEIGCLELENHVGTGAFFHTYINPKRNMPAQAERIHGLSEEFLKDKPDFNEIVEDFTQFIGESDLIIHNAPFDLGFLNVELEKSSNDKIAPERVVDTLLIARKKFPGAPANLDALCRRFEIDLSGRTKHGALLDAQLLAEVYLELIGGRQPGLVLDNIVIGSKDMKDSNLSKSKYSTKKYIPNEAELTEHAKFLKKITNPIWKR